MATLERLIPEPRFQENSVLRRYVDLAKYLSFLKSRSLYLCRVDLLQDKFEGSFTPSLRAAIEGSYEKNKVDFTYADFKKNLRECVYVSCWSLGADDNAALWSLYGKSQYAVAVTTTVGRLRDALQSWEGQGRIAIRKVKYVKHWRDPKLDIKPYSKVFQYKVVAYSFEKEVRVILDVVPPKNFETSERVEGHLVPVRLSAFIRSVVVSPEAPEWFFDLV